MLYKDAPINDRYNIQPDYIKMMEGKIDALVQSNNQILNIISHLESKIDRILEAVDMDGEGSKTKNNFDLMDTLEIMNKLNNIDQYIRSVAGKAMHSDVLEPNQIQVIENFVAAIENKKRNLGQTSTDLFNQVSLICG